MNVLSFVLYILGAISCIYGFLVLGGIIKTDTSRDSALDKKVLSEKNRYFIGRYWAGSQFIAVGFGLILFGLIL